MRNPTASKYVAMLVATCMRPSVHATTAQCHSVSAVGEAARRASHPDGKRVIRELDIYARYAEMHRFLAAFDAR